MPSLHVLRRVKPQKKAVKNSTIIGVLLALLFLFPEYPKRLIYPFLFGEKTSEKLEISQDGSYEDVNPNIFNFTRNNYLYKLQPKTKYNITAKIGYVDHYDTFFNKMYRGHSQSEYLNLVPVDLLMVYGDMAKPEIYKLFEFDHEERTGFIKCKGVKYKESFFSFYSSASEREKSEKNYSICNPHINPNQFNNYHPIPSNEKINKGLHTLLAGDIVYLEGYLVDVPSMGMLTGTRTNQHHEYVMSGQNPGMCFILFTTKLTVNGYTYQ